MFPGQGAQYVGMGKDFYDTYDEAKEVYKLASEATGLDVEALCFTENDKLNITEYTQIAMLATEVATLKILEKKLEEKGVTNIPHFGPLYRFKVVSAMGYDEEEIAKTCPNCEEVFYKRFTHLPLYGLSDEQVEYMADAVLEAVAEMQAGK